MKPKDCSGTPPASEPSGAADSGPNEAAATEARRPELEPLTQAAQIYASEARAAGTRDTYTKHWNAFAAWCAGQGVCALPAAPQAVAQYLAARADQQRRPATLSVTLSAIAWTHELAGHTSPVSDRVVEQTWLGIRRRLGTAPTKKDPLSARELRRMMDALPAGLLGLRDRSLLLLGFAGGFRRSEFIALNAADLKFVSEGLEAFVASSKTDQERKGHTKMVVYGSDPATCPVRAVKDWLELASVADAPVFRPVNRHEQARERAPHGSRGRGDRQTNCVEGRTTYPRAFRPFAARRLRHRSGEERRRLSGDHGPDRSRKSDDGSRLQPAEEEVGEARQREARLCER